MRPHIVHHPDYVVPLPASGDGGPPSFPMTKFGLTMQALRQTAPALVEHQPDPVTRADLVAAHCPAYVDAVLAGTLDAERTRRIGFTLTPAVVRRSLLASGGTLLAARLALAHGFAANTAGGSHHAHPGFGAGYCVFNDVAVMARRLLEEAAIGRLLIVDLDVHQGDGTAAIFAGEPRVFTFSMHCETNFPLRKTVSDLDIALPAGADDTHYLSRLAEALPHVMDRARPDLIAYVAGVDVHAEDQLGRLALSDAGLAARDTLVAGAARSAGVPLVSVMGGGYGRDRAAVARRHAASILCLAGELARLPSPACPAGR